MFLSNCFILFGEINVISIEMEFLKNVTKFIIRDKAVYKRGTKLCSIWHEMHQLGQSRVLGNTIKLGFLQFWCILSKFLSGAFPNPCTKNAPLLLKLGQSRVLLRNE